MERMELICMNVFMNKNGIQLNKYFYLLYRCVNVYILKCSIYFFISLKEMLFTYKL